MTQLAFTAVLPCAKRCCPTDASRSTTTTSRPSWPCCVRTGSPPAPWSASSSRAFAEVTGAAEAVAVSNGTAALHAAVHALNIGPGDEVIVPTMTFAATANCVVYQGGTPVFVDVDPETLLIDPAQVEAKITPRTQGGDRRGLHWSAVRLPRAAGHHGSSTVWRWCPTPVMRLAAATGDGRWERWPI